MYVSPPPSKSTLNSFNKAIFKKQNVSVEELLADSCPTAIWCS